MLFPVILRRISPTPIGHNPGFLSRGMSRHAANVSIDVIEISSVQNFLIKFAIAFLRSTFVSPKLHEQRILLHASASIAQGPEPPFVLMAAFLTISSSIPANLIGCTLCEIPVNKMSMLPTSDSGCFSFKLFRV